MNRFITLTEKEYFLGKLFLLGFLLVSLNNVVYAFQSSDSLNSYKIEATLDRGGAIHADIDTVNNRVLLMNKEGLWEYDLEQDTWAFLNDLGQLPKELNELESGYLPEQEAMLFWDRGVGSFYRLNLETYRVTKLDNSHNHRNQFDHQAFIREGTVYAFGGYGYWIWKNYITYFNKELEEWNLQNVAPESEVPSARTPLTGIHVTERDEFYLFGGRVPNKKRRADDQYTERSDLYDIWKFSFNTNEWFRLGRLNHSFEYYENSAFRRFGRTNSLSTSFYSESSKLWYLPTIQGGRGDLIYLTPVDITTGDILKPVSLPNNDLDSFLPSNFLFHQESSRMVLVGVEKASEAKELPIRIIEIPEDSLLNNIAEATSIFDRSLFIYASGGLAVLLILIFYLWNGRLSPDSAGELMQDEQELLKYSWLKEEEKLLLKQFIDRNALLESEDIEAIVWEDIENYDYRRKLKNETINRINEKFRKKFEISEDVIQRVKDPEDNRRYLYKLNDRWR